MKFAYLFIFIRLHSIGLVRILCKSIWYIVVIFINLEYFKPTYSKLFGFSCFIQ